MKENGLKCNIEKSFLGKTEMEQLGFGVTYDGVNPINKNISNKNMKSTTYQKYLCQFIGVVNYYRDMWEKCSHTLAPFTNIT